MPWAKRADGTWGNVEAPTPTTSTVDHPPPPPLVAPHAPPLPPPSPSPQPHHQLPIELSGTKRRPAPPRPAKPPKPNLLATPTRAEVEVIITPDEKPVAPWLAELRQAKASASLIPPRRTPSPPPPFSASPQHEVEEPGYSDQGEEEIEEYQEEVKVVETPRPSLPKRGATVPVPPPPTRRAAPPIPTRPSFSELNPTQSLPAPPPIPSNRPPLPTRRTTPSPYSSPSSSTLALPSYDSDSPVTETLSPPPPSSSAPPLTSHRPPPTRLKSSSSYGARDNTSTPSWSDDKAGYAKNKAIEFARNRQDPLDPPPVCFSRPAPQLDEEEMKGFTTIVIRSNNSNDLAKAMTTGRAFPNMPHSIPSRDIFKEDWERLWNDIDEMARVELRTSAGISLATLPLKPIFGAGFVVSQVAERKLRANRVGPTCNLVEAWNVRFFRPRNLDVYIAQDSMRLSGPALTPEARKVYDPAYLKMQEATDEYAKARAVKEYEKYQGKFRFVIQNWR